MHSTAMPNTPRRRRSNQNKQKRKTFSNSILFLIVMFSCIQTTTNATNVKWTPGNNQEAAQTAPRSQKYWDEHGIKRPEYGYTDAEIAARNKNKGGGGLASLLWFGIMGGIAYSLYLKYTTGKFVPPNWSADSHRLGTTTTNSTSSGISGSIGNLMQGVMKGGNGDVRAEEARKARLARFGEQKQSSFSVAAAVDGNASGGGGGGEGVSLETTTMRTSIAMKKGE